jgi:medium-chain acyl-[acyl-carrier-protein] hydrolase
MGALMGFELARYLRKAGCATPLHLFVSGARAPHVPDPYPPIHRLPDLWFVEQLRRLQGTPEAVLQNSELMMLLLPALRADFMLCETYVHVWDDPLDCPITTYGGQHDGRVLYGDLLGWQYHTRRSFNVRMLPGDHFFIHGSRPWLLSALSHDLHHLVPELVHRQHEDAV